MLLDIEQLEKLNKVSVFVYYIDETDDILREKVGNINYIHNDIIYLLRIRDETKSHYVYIKHISRLLHLKNYVIDKDKQFCPFCNKDVMSKNYTKHIKEHTNINDGANITLMEKGSYMKFEN